MQELLFLSQRIPYPPNKGDKIRSWHILRHLSERYRIHLGCFIDDPHDWQHAPRLRDMAADSMILGLRPGWAKLRALPALTNGQPLTLGYFRDRRMAAWVQDRLERRPISAVFVFSSAMAGYVMTGVSPCVRRVADLVDVDSAKWGQYAEHSRWPMSALYERECATLGAFEVEVARRFDATLLVSDPEADLLRGGAPDVADRIHAVDNGVDHRFFAPENGGANPYPAEVLPIVFTGAMDYRPNIDAVIWFAREVMPKLTARLPQACFYIVGAQPVSAVETLATPGRVVVTGRVPDVRGYLAHAAAVVAPLRIAQGVQNKVLEAMAMARPVVVTPQALVGLRAEPGQHLLVADTADAFADTVAAAVDLPGMRALGRRARQQVVENYDWRRNLARLDTVLAGRPAGAAACVA